jgi:hypothetical protein
MKARHRLSKVIVFGVVVAIVALWGLNPVEAGTGVLDGKIFLGQTGENDKKASDEDELRFQDGKLYSVGCAEWGFDAGAYTTRNEGDNIYFEAETASPKHGKIVWKGTVQGDKINANYVWTKKRWYWKDAHQEKWFQGSLKK